VVNKTADSVVDTDAAGTIAVKTDKDKTHLYFQYKGADTLLKSDLIPISNILYGTSSNKGGVDLKKAVISLDDEVNGGELVAGQDYITRIEISQFAGMSDEDIYQKYGIVHAYTGLTVDNFYKKMALSLAINFSREISELFQFGVETESGTTIVTPLTKLDDLKDVTGIKGVAIIEVEQEWTLGVKSRNDVKFNVYAGEVLVDGEERTWGTVTLDKKYKHLDNGKEVADMEYFYMGSRGDMYRGIGWPNYIPTKYLVDPTKKYALIDLHYFYAGANEHVQKSEKTITFAVEGDTLANTLIGAINTAAGISIPTIE
jgi:hypothetical protein